MIFNCFYTKRGTSHQTKERNTQKGKSFFRELKVDTVEQKTIYSDKKMFSTEIAVNNLNDGLQQSLRIL